MESKTGTILLDDLAKALESPYEAVLIAAKRARLINTNRLAKMELMTEDTTDLIDYRKVTTQALEDLLTKKIKYHYNKE